MEINVTRSTKKLAEITATSRQKLYGRSAATSALLLMQTESQARTLITQYAASAESFFAKSPGIVNLPDGKLRLLHIDNTNDIRKLVDV